MAENDPVIIARMVFIGIPSNNIENIVLEAGALKIAARRGVMH